MGQSTDAILFFGVCWQEEMRESALWSGLRDEDEDEEGWESRFARVVLGKEVGSPKFNEYTLAAKSSCEVSSHCSGDCPMPFVAHRESNIRAWRGDPKEIDAGLTSTDTTRWEAEVREFCDKMGIKIDGMRVGWWLVSDWN